MTVESIPFTNNQGENDLHMTQNTTEDFWFIPGVFAIGRFFILKSSRLL